MPARQVPADVAPCGREVAEQQRLLVGVVVGVGLAHARAGRSGAAGRTRRSACCSNGMHLRRRLAALLVALEAGRPERHAAQGRPRTGGSCHRHRVGHLLVEPRVALGGRQAVLGQHVGVVQVDGRVEATARRVAVDHLDVLADRAGLELVAVGEFPGEFEGDLVGAEGVELGREQRVEREDAEPPDRAGGGTSPGCRGRPSTDGRRRRGFRRAGRGRRRRLLVPSRRPRRRRRRPPPPRLGLGGGTRRVGRTGKGISCRAPPAPERRSTCGARSARMSRTAAITAKVAGSIMCSAPVAL